MLRKASVLLGLAVLLSLLFPAKLLLKDSGIDLVAVQLPVLDLAAFCALVAIAPAWYLFRDAGLAQRIPRWSAWVTALALCSLVFLLLHVTWSADLVISFVGSAVADGALPAYISQHALVDAAELAARLGVLVSLVAVLVRLETAPDPDALPPPAAPRRRKK